MPDKNSDKSHQHVSPNASARPLLSAIEAFHMVCGKPTGTMRIADIGCGGGAMSRALAALGAKVTGIDPVPHMIEAAQRAGGGPTYKLAFGEATELDSGSFDIVFYSKSLHHIPDMAAAIDEALRIVRPNGTIIVLEPEADDPAYPVFRWMDDEKAVYDEAQGVLNAAIAAGRLQRLDSLFFAEKYRVNNVQEVIAELQNIDQTRTITADDALAMGKCFDNAYQQDELGGYLESWYRCDAFAPTVQQ